MEEKKLCVDSNFKIDKLPYTFEGSKWDHNAEHMILDEYPLQIDFDLNTTCNYRCIMCFRDFMTPEVEHMELETVYDILDQCKGKIESIKLNYRGEPLLYPKLVDVIKRAKEYGIYVHFNTNGSLLTEEKSKELIFSGVDRIIVSMESMFPNIYEQIRRGGDFKKVLYNITMLRFWRDRYDKKTPIIEILATKQELNKKEIDSGIFQSFWYNIVDSIQIAECFELYEDEEDLTPLPEWHCGQLWQRLLILSDGQVIPCCVGVNYKSNKIYSIGNINKETIIDIWNSKKLNKIRELHMKGESHKVEMCKSCRLRKYVLKLIKNEEISTFNLEDHQKTKTKK